MTSIQRSEGSRGRLSGASPTMLNARQAVRALAERRTRIVAPGLGHVASPVPVRNWRAPARDEGTVRTPDYAGSDRRRARRRFSPLRAIIDGHRYVVVNWSATGFAVSGFTGGKVLLGQPFLITIAIPLAGPKSRVRLIVEVTRYDSTEGILAFSFGSVDDRTLEILSRYAVD